MNGFFRKLIAAADRVALVGIPKERRKPPYGDALIKDDRDPGLESSSNELEPVKVELPKAAVPEGVLVDMQTRAPADAKDYQVKKFQLETDQPRPVSPVAVPQPSLPAAPTVQLENKMPPLTTAVAGVSEVAKGVATEKNTGAPAFQAGEKKETKVETIKAEEKKPRKTDSLADLFKKTESEEKSPVEKLVATLADTAAEELLTELKELEILMKQNIDG